jgi:hypothetical protein
MKKGRRQAYCMAETRDAREKELIEIGAADCIRLIRIYQVAIGTPNGQIPIPGIPQRRMIDVILKKEFPAAATSKSGKSGDQSPRE